MRMIWFYTMSGGYAGTDEYGLVEAENEEEAYKNMENDAYQLAADWHEDSRGGGYTQGEEGLWYDDEGEEVDGPEIDLSIDPYNPEKHNGYLSGSEEGYIITE